MVFNFHWCDIFVFSGIPGHLREKVENLLHPFHTDQGWPAPFEIKVPIWRKKLWEIKYKERDFSIFDASKDPVRSLKRSDFDLDWQYVDSFHMPSSFVTQYFKKILFWYKFVPYSKLLVLICSERAKVLPPCPPTPYGPPQAENF
jgi:hypothetical protein